MYRIFIFINFAIKKYLIYHIHYENKEINSFITFGGIE